MNGIVRCSVEPEVRLTILKQTAEMEKANRRSQNRRARKCYHAKKQSRLMAEAKRAAGIQ